MTYFLAIPPTVELSLKNLHPGLKAKIKEALKAIQKNPHFGKPLKGKLVGLMSFRATHYRIVYRLAFQERRIEIVDIGPRKSIYEKLFKWKLP